MSGPLAWLIPSYSPKELEVMRKTPLLICHGEADELFPIDIVKMTHDHIFNEIYNGANGKNLTYLRGKELGHEIN